MLFGQINDELPSLSHCWCRIDLFSLHEEDGEDVDTEEGDVMEDEELGVVGDVDVVVLLFGPPSVVVVACVRVTLK